MKKKIMLKSILFAILICYPALSNSQNPNRERSDDYNRNNFRKIISIPDIPGFYTLTGDFHMHTVFSDGEVWPTVRVEEAWREGLDVIAITDHVEYQSHKKYIPKDLNASFEIAQDRAHQRNIILIKGTEITRGMPPGHFNALFVKDADSLDHEDPMVQIEKANSQGAFVLWNHPGWANQQPDTTKWWDFHTEIYEKGWLHGIEVFNYDDWYPLVLDWCIEKDLAVFANSDIHEPIDQKYNFDIENSHRPQTILFCAERSEAGVREALFAGRTLGWFGTTLVGKEDLIAKLCKASLKLHQTQISSDKQDKEQFNYELRNQTDITYSLRLLDGSGKNRIIDLPPFTSYSFMMKEKMDSMSFDLVNCYSGSQIHPKVTIKVINIE